MGKENNEEKFVIEGNPGQGNTFVKIGHVENYNPNATTVSTTITSNNYYGKHEGEEGESTPSSAKPGDKKLGNMTLRDMLKGDYIDTGNIQKKIMNYVSCIRPYVKDDMDKLYMHLWAVILDHEVFKVDLYDPGKQQCTYNRNLVANIIHYLDSKGFYEEQYSAAAMTRTLEAGEDQHPIRRALGMDPEPKYCKVVDEILTELEEK